MAEHANYVVNRMLADIEYLVQIGHLSSSDAQSIGTILQGTSSQPAVIPTPTRSNVYSPPVHSPPPSNAAGRNLAAAARLKVPPPPPSAPLRAVSPARPHDTVEAVWAYEAAEANELSLAEGERVEVLDRDNEGWWRGRSSTTGQEGLFPSNYVKEAATSAIPALPSRSLPPSYTPSTTSAVQPASEKQWKAPTARFSSGAPSKVPPPPPQGEYNAAGPSHSGLPVPDHEDREKKNAQFKKVGAHVGKSAAGGFGAGIGFGLARSIF